MMNFVEPPVEPGPVPEAPGFADAELLVRAGRGDAAAARMLFDRWRSPLLGFFHRHLGSHADAEDLTLEVFVRLQRAAPDYAPTAKFPTFLFHIARNLLLNEQRRRRRKPAIPTEPAAFDHWCAAADGAERRAAETEEILEEALQRLPKKYRTPLRLVQQRALEYPAAAEQLRVTENALRVLVHRGRRLLKREMKALG